MKAKKNPSHRNKPVLVPVATDGVELQTPEVVAMPTVFDDDGKIINSAARAIKKLQRRLHEKQQEINLLRTELSNSQNDHLKHHAIYKQYDTQFQQSQMYNQFVSLANQQLLVVLGSLEKRIEFTPEEKKSSDEGLKIIEALRPKTKMEPEGSQTNADQTISHNGDVQLEPHSLSSPEDQNQENDNTNTTTEQKNSHPNNSEAATA